MSTTIQVNIGDLFTTITRNGETMTLPTNDTVIGLFRFILEDDCTLFVNDNRIDREEDLNYAM
jgi:hypothetical protein